MTVAEQHERTILMLERYRDALHASTPTPTGDGHDSRILWSPPEFNAAFRELDRCLNLMRTTDQHAGTTLRHIRWHVIAWHVDTHYRQIPIRPLKTPPKGWTPLSAKYRLEPKRHRDANHTKAAAGVHWISTHYNWHHITLRTLNDACGTTQHQTAA